MGQSNEQRHSFYEPYRAERERKDHELWNSKSMLLADLKTFGKNMSFHVLKEKHRETKGCPI